MEPQVRRILARLRNRKYLFVFSSFVFLLSIWKLFSTNSKNQSNEHYQKRSQLSINISAAVTESTTFKPKPIINPYPYNFTMNTSPCTEDEKLVVVVHSAVTYKERRQLLRNMWLNKEFLNKNFNIGVKIIFVTGATLDPIAQTYLEYEQEVYDDIIQSSFIDSYNNNAHKAVSYMRWVSSPSGCPKASLILKVDDDALLHPARMPQLNRTIHSLLNHSNPDIYSGRLLTRLVNRDNTSKWYVSWELWPEELYPVWFQGLVYVLTPSLAAKLYPIALTTRYMFTDDVYVGVLVSQVPEASVIINNDLGIHADHNDYSVLEPVFVNGSHIFSHVPDKEVYYKWYYREDVGKYPNQGKQKDQSVALTLFLIFFSIFIFVSVILCVFCFMVPDDDGLSSQKE